MANANQLLTLIKSHLNGDEERFRTTAMQIASAELKAGHNVLAGEIDDLLKRKGKQYVIKHLNMLGADFDAFFSESEKPYLLHDLVCGATVLEKLKRVITEFNCKEILYQHGLTNRRKILLTGPSGTGKTMSAAILAAELNMPLYVIRMERIVSKFMGETSLKLGQVFDYISRLHGVFLFDEFDAIGLERGRDNEVGEMRRILNSFLQFLEKDASTGLIIAATNSIESLDKALFRRFDDVIEYVLPAESDVRALLERKLARFGASLNIERVLPLMKRMSHAEITMVCDDAVKMHLLENKPIDVSLIEDVVSSRYQAYNAG